MGETTPDAQSAERGLDDDLPTLAPRDKRNLAESEREPGAAGVQKRDPLIDEVARDGDDGSRSDDGVIGAQMIRCDLEISAYFHHLTTAPLHAIFTHRSPYPNKGATILQVVPGDPQPRVFFINGTSKKSLKIT